MKNFILPIIWAFISINVSSQTINCSSNAPICAGDTLYLTETGGDAESWAWEGPNEFSSTSVSPVIANPDETYSGMYYVTISDINSNIAIDSVDVTIHPKPGINASGNSPVCEGDDIILTEGYGDAMAWEWSGPNKFNSVNQNPTISAATTNASGTYTVTITDGNGCIDTDDVTVTVNSLPTANAGNDISVCDGESVTLTATGGSSYEWSGSVEQGVSFTPTSTTTYTVTVTDANGCEDTDDVTVTVNALPSTSSITGNATPNCNESGVTYSVILTSGSSYAWSVPNGATITSGATGPENNSITVDFGSSNGDITVTETNAEGCTGTPQSLTVCCGLNPDFSADNTSICDGDTVVFTNQSTGTSASSTFSWDFGTGANPATATGEGPHAVVYTGTGTKTVSLEVTEGVTLTETKTDYITVNAIPTADAGSDETICNGQRVTLTAIGGGDYSWSSGSNTASTTVSPITTTTYSVTVTSAAGCTDTDDVTVTVEANPTADAGSDETICNGESVTLTASGGDDYAWSSGDNTATITVSPISTTTYTVTVTNVTGCIDTDDVTVTVNDLPSTSSITGNDEPNCNATDETYSVTLTSGSSYAWTVPNGATITSGETGPENNSITVDFGSSNGDITVTETNAEGCTGTEQSLTVSLVGCGLTPDFSADKTSICDGDTVVFTNLSTGISGLITYTWDFGTGASPAIGFDEGPYTVIYTGSGSRTVSLEVTDDYAVTATETKTDYITVNSLPTATAGSNSPVCAGKDINLIESSGYASSWSWSGPNEFSSSIQQPFIDSAGILLTGIYAVTITDSAGCKNVSSVKVMITDTSTLVVTNPPKAYSINLTDPAIIAGSTGGWINTEINKDDWAACSDMTNFNDAHGINAILNDSLNTHFRAKTNITKTTHKNYIIINMQSVYQMSKIDITSGDSVFMDGACEIYLSSDSLQWTKSAQFDSVLPNSIKSINLNGDSAQYIKLHLTTMNTELWDIKEITCYTLEQHITYWEDSLATIPVNNPDSITESGTYYIKLGIDPYAEIQSVNVSLIGSGTSENMISDNTPSVYPNPLYHGTLQLKSSGFIQNEKIEISVLNVLGEAVFAKQIHPGASNKSDIQILNREDIPEGVYIIQISDGKSVSNHKLIVE